MVHRWAMLVEVRVLGVRLHGIVPTVVEVPNVLEILPASSPPTPPPVAVLGEVVIRLLVCRPVVREVNDDEWSRIARPYVLKSLVLKLIGQKHMVLSIPIYFQFLPILVLTPTPSLPYPHPFPYLLVYRKHPYPSPN